MEQLAYLKKSILIFGLLFVVCLACMYGSYRLHAYGEYRTHKETRHARMIDVFDRHSHVKGHDYYYTYGYFVDRDSGNHFTDGITEITFKSFKNNGNKGVETSWPYSIDKMEQTSKGQFSLIFGFIFMTFFTFFGIFNASQLIMASYHYKELKRNLINFKINRGFYMQSLKVLKGRNTDEAFTEKEFKQAQKELKEMVLKNHSARKN